MAKYRLAQCEIRNAEEYYKESVVKYNDGLTNLRNSIERLVRMLNHLDYNLLKLKNQVQIIYIDGEYVSFYHAYSVEVDENNDVIVVAVDDYGDDEKFELSDLSYDEIYCIGSTLFDQYQQKYGNVMTYKDMVEASKKII